MRKHLMTSAPSETIGIGHNQGPALHAGSWTGYCWNKARREVWGNPPVEVIRMRKRRADELGLSYRQYASILLDRGVRTEALVFDLTALPANAPTAPLDGMAAKLRTLRNCKIFAAIDGTDALVRDLNARAGNIIADWTSYPPQRTAPRTAQRGGRAVTLLQPVLDMLARHLVAPSAAVMIADGMRAGRIAQTARLARVFPALAYFPGAYFR